MNRGNPCSSRATMNRVILGEVLSAPTTNLSASFVHGVPSDVGYEATDIGKAFRAVQLQCAPNVVWGLFLELLAFRRANVERPSSDAELRVLSEFAEYTGHVAVAKNDVGVEAGQEIIVRKVKAVKGARDSALSAWCSLFFGRQPDHFDHSIDVQVLDDIPGSIRGTIVHDNPFRGPWSLSHHRGNHLSDELLFIVRRRDECVSRHRASI